MRSCRLVIAALLTGGLWGCLEVVRRPADRAAPAWSAPQAAGRDTLTAPVLPLKRQPAAKKSKTEGERSQPGIRQVNEYALWCVENGMWKEARLHLEQAASRDSQAASLHNNLGIVYEHLGLEEEATAAYRRAQALRPGQEAYRSNLQRLENRHRAPRDSLAPPPEAQDSTDQAHPALPTGE